jgi:hypothetical protein
LKPRALTGCQAIFPVAFQTFAQKIGKMKVGPLSIDNCGMRIIELAPVVGSRERAHVSVYSLNHRNGWKLEVAYAKFMHSTDVRCLEYSDSTPDALHRLTHGLRMSVLDGPNRNTQWAELSQARLDKSVTPAWSTLRRATERELSNAAQAKVRSILNDFGGDLGTRAQLLDDASRRRSYLCTVFARDSQEAPIAAYALTRILPLANEWS